jgi:cyclopropane-fatty-acyl-phospholipid synthase
MSLRHRVLQHLRSRLAADALPLRLVFWDGERFDFAALPSVTITLHSRKLLRLLLAGNFAALGDAYVAGQIGVDGPIADIMRVGITLAERVGKSTALSRLGRIASLVPRRHSPRQDRADVGYHYDVGNDFYRLWLDENMIYSCAYFKDGTEDIDLAQRQKLDHICRKLEILKQDYRDLADDAGFDKIVSVGMYEHVGIRNLPRYFATVRRLLRPGGAFLNHGIVATDPHGRAQGPAGGEFIERYVFPGGAVPHLSRVVFNVARAGLEFADAEDLRPHYARTLAHWSRRLEARRDEAIRAAGERRYRIWRVYLAGMAHAFDRGWLSVAQVLAFRPAQHGGAYRPWTRSYQYRDARAALGTGGVPLAGQLDLAGGSAARRGRPTRTAGPSTNWS